MRFINILEQQVPDAQISYALALIRLTDVPRRYWITKPRKDLATDVLQATGEDRQTIESCEL